MAGDQIMHAQPEVLGISEKFLDLCLVFDWWNRFIHNYIFAVCVATDGTNNYLYNQLWKLCAGPLFHLPKVGEKINYFPQGHIEQAIFFLFFTNLLYSFAYVLICKTYS